MKVAAFTAVAGCNKLGAAAGRLPVPQRAGPRHQPAGHNERDDVAQRAQHTGMSNAKVVKNQSPNQAPAHDDIALQSSRHRNHTGVKRQDAACNEGSVRKLAASGGSLAWHEHGRQKCPAQRWVVRDKARAAAKIRVRKVRGITWQA